MSLTIMQLVDNWIGLPLAWLLGLFTKRTRCLGGDADAATPVKRVIVLKWIGLGSIVLALPLLEELKRKGIEVAFWTFEGHEGAIELSGLADRVWVVRKRGWRLPLSILMALLEARRFKADAILDLEPTSNGTACVARLIGAPIRAGFLVGKPAREALFTHLVAVTGGRHMAENCLMLAHSIGVPAIEHPSLPALKLPAAPKTDPTRKRVVFNSNTSDLGRELRRWPDSHWIELGVQLLRDPSVDLSFTGVKAEYLQNERIIEGIRKCGDFDHRVTNLAGKTSVPDLLSFLKSADLVVSVDSGVMHLAAWSGAPLIGLFGAENPSLYRPLSPGARPIWLGLACSPCCTVVTEKHTRCRDNRCMKDIAPAQVRLLCEEMLRGKRLTGPVRIAG